MVADEIADDLLDSHRTCIYRVVQEALNNCAKHSRATQARVVVRQDRDGLSASVQDDGVGFDPSQEKGMGMLGMEERVERLGGRFNVESQPGHGAVLSIRFPMRRRRMIRIVLADDHAVMRRGLRLVLEQQKDFQVLAEANDGREAMSLVESLSNPTWRCSTSRCRT